MESSGIGLKFAKGKFGQDHSIESSGIGLQFMRRAKNLSKDSSGIELGLSKGKLNFQKKAVPHIMG